MSLPRFTTVLLCALFMPVTCQTGNGDDAPAVAAERSWNFERVGTMMGGEGNIDLQTTSKLAPWPTTDGRYLYSGCYDPAPLMPKDTAADRCFLTVDIGDPLKPVRSATMYTFDRVNSPSPPASHIIWSGDYPFPNLPVQTPCTVDWNDEEISAGIKPPPCWDPGWNTHTHYVQKGPGNVLAVNQERYREGTDRQASFHGIKFYDVADPSTPVFLSYWEAPVTPPDPETGVYPDANGTHHFNFSGPYLYLGTEYHGFIGKILVILDTTDPRHPREVGKWWMPGQKTPEEDSLRDWEQQPYFIFPVIKNENGKWIKHVGMHYVTVYRDRAYLSYQQAGLIILDVSDRSKPRLISHTDYLVPGYDPTNPDIEACRRAAGGVDAACGNAHSAKLIPGRDDLLLMSDEYFTCPFGHVRIFDVKDQFHPKIISHFLTDLNLECDPDRPQQPANAERYRVMFPQIPLMVGPSSHIGNAWGSDLYFMAWYGAGLRAIDISNPHHPVEVGYYQYRIDKDVQTRLPGFAGSHTYDVIFGPGGFLYVSDASAGLRVLRYTGPGGPPAAQ